MPVAYWRFICGRFIQVAEAHYGQRQKRGKN